MEGTAAAGRLLVFAPMPSELRPVVKLLRLPRTGEQGGLAVHAGAVGRLDVVVTGTGIGPAMAAAAADRMLTGSRYDHVVVCGIAGGLAPASHVGDLVVPEEVVDGATGERYLATPLGGVEACGRIRTGDGDDYALDDTDVAALVAEAVTAVDMETAAVARACHQQEIPWTAFRAISDMAGSSSLGPEVLDLVDELGRPRTWAAMRYLATHPHRLPTMARVGRDAAAAANVAARATVAAIREHEAAGARP